MLSFLSLVAVSNVKNGQFINTFSVSLNPPSSNQCFSYYWTVKSLTNFSSLFYTLFGILLMILTWCEWWSYNSEWNYSTTLLIFSLKCTAWEKWPTHWPEIQIRFEGERRKFWLSVTFHNSSQWVTSSERGAQ